MTFASPWLLLGLVLVALAVLAYVLHERRAARSRAAFAAPGLMPAVAPRRAGWRRHVPMAIYALALAALAVALARPQVTATVTVERATVVLVTDRSGSMLARDVQPNRLVAARRAAESFLESVPPEVRVGAIAFNQTATALQSPTDDHAAVRRALGTVEAAGSTATGDALELALRMARTGTAPAEEAPPAAIVLLTDGASVRGRDPVAVAEEAGEAGVPIYTVALGTDDGEIERPAPGGGTRRVPVPPDPESLRRIAEASGAEAFTAPDAARLSAVYERLGSQLATEEQPREITAAFAGGALVLIVLAAAGSLLWFGRLP